MFADLILTYGMATRVRRLPVSPTVITSVLFKANPSLPSVISWGWHSLWLARLTPVHSVSTSHEISLASFGNIVTDMLSVVLRPIIVKLSLDLSPETGGTRRRCLWPARGVKTLFANDSDPNSRVCLCQYEVNISGFRIGAKTRCQDLFQMICANM